MLEQAKWIWGDFPEEANQYADFIMDFELESVREDASFAVSVDKDYVAYINGVFVGCGQFHDYPEQKVYDEYAIKDFLKIGKNRLFITGNYQGKPSMQYAKGERAICFAIKNGEDVFVSDKQVLSAKSKAYQSGDIYKITGQLGYGAIVKGTDDAKLPEAEIGTEFQASIEKNVSTILSKRPIQKLEIGEKIATRVVAQGTFLRKEKEGTTARLMQKDFLSSCYFEEIFEGDCILPGKIISKKTDADGVYLVLDMGKEESGYFTLDIDIRKNARIDISYGEHLDDLRVRAYVGMRNFAYTYYTKEGRQQFTHYFKRIAGRYIELHIKDAEEFTLYYAGVYPARYPVTPKGHFRCNDSLHNKIYEVSIETLKQCMHEHYEDCPWREQALYSSDSRNQMLCGYYVFDNPEFARSSLELLGKGLSTDGYLKICSPTDEELKIPSFSFLWLLELKEYTEYTNDVSLAQQMWQTIESLLETQAERMQDGLLRPPVGENYWNFYEWSKGYDGISYDDVPELERESEDFADGMYQVIAYLAIKSAVWMAERIGNCVFVKKYTDILTQMKKTIRKRFYNQEKNLYAAFVKGNESLLFGELMQVMVIYTGISEGVEAQNIRNELYRGTIEPKTALSYSVYKYDVLMQEPDKYKKYVFDEIANRWGKMLFQGATTFWETDDGADDFYKAGSMCHGWSAIPIYFYFRYVLGITADNVSGRAKGYTPVDGIFAEFSGDINFL